MISFSRHLTRIRTLIWLFFGLVGVSLGQDRQDQAGLLIADGKINLRILCTTSPTEGRTDDFVEFLNRHFVKVATTDYESFREELARDYDVVIIDYGATRPGSPVPQRLSRGYSRATVTMGVSGSMVGRRLGLKTGYL
jgi:hypothetical protein